MNELREKLLKGMLNIVVLRLIADQPTYGYNIISSIRKRYGVYFGPSTIYPILCALEKKGYLKSEWTYPITDHPRSPKPTTPLLRPRKIYVITEKGKTLLGCGQTELETIVKPLIQVRANA